MCISIIRGLYNVGREVDACSSSVHVLIKCIYSMKHYLIPRVPTKNGSTLNVGCLPKRVLHLTFLKWQIWWYISLTGSNNLGLLWRTVSNVLNAKFTRSSSLNLLFFSNRTVMIHFFLTLFVLCQSLFSMVKFHSVASYQNSIYTSFNFHRPLLRTFLSNQIHPTCEWIIQRCSHYELSQYIRTRPWSCEEYRCLCNQLLVKSIITRSDPST